MDDTHTFIILLEVTRALAHIGVLFYITRSCLSSFYDAQDLKALVVMEDEPSSPESHDTTKEKVVKTFLEMTLWGEVCKELKNKKMTTMSEVD